jgi:UDPglucose 6-dehydrogenase
MTSNISVIGLGKLGASMAAALASKGFMVTGVDIVRDNVDKINRGEAPVSETDLQKYITENKKRLRATMNHAEAVLESDISFVIVPTPSDERGAFSLQYAQYAFRELGKALKKKDGYHLVVMTSTVLPGATRHGLMSVLEKESGKKCGPDFGLCYSPEFIALGSVIRDYLNPDFSLIGEFDNRSGEMLEAFYHEALGAETPCARMSLENAELTKVSVNSYVTTKISFANTILSICSRMPGGDADAVCGALGLDKRIGKKYLKGALGFGGPCFPRDNRALSFFADSVGVDATVSKATDAVNQRVVERVIESVRPHIESGATVAVLGLSYKPHSPVIEESQGIQIVEALTRLSVRVVAYDPQARANARAHLNGKVMVLDSLADCLYYADVVVVANDDPTFKALTPEQFGQGNDSVVVLDAWRCLSNEVQSSERVHYIGFGSCSSPDTWDEHMASLWNPSKVETEKSAETVLRAAM